MATFINKNNKTIKLLLDRSGSMSSDGMLKALISGSNSLILEQRQSAEDLNEDINIEIYVFNNELLLIRSGEIKEISNILENEVEPRCTTSLNDSLAKILEDGKDQSDVILFIFTDGQENSSILHPGNTGKKYCSDLIENLTSNNKWTIIFGAANIDAYTTASEYGVNTQNTININATGTGVSALMRGVSSSIRQSSQTGDDIDVTGINSINIQPDSTKIIGVIGLVNPVGINTVNSTGNIGVKRKNEDCIDNLSRSPLKRS